LKSLHFPAHETYYFQPEPRRLYASLEKISITGHDHIASTILDRLAHCPSLTTIHLGRCHHMEFTAQMFPHLRHLRIDHLGPHELRPCKYTLAKSITTLAPQLESLRLSDCMDMNTIRYVFACTYPRLRSLCLRGLLIRFDNEDETIAIWAHLFPVLETLDINVALSGSDDCALYASIRASIRECTHLTSLKTTNRAAYLMQDMRKCEQFVFSEAFASLPLRHLWVGQGTIDSDQWEFFCKGNSTLTTLTTSHAFLSPHLFKHLHHLTSLKTLVMHDMAVSDSSRIYHDECATLLYQCTSLTKLHLSNIPLPMYFIERIRDHLPHLQTLSLPGCYTKFPKDHSLFFPRASH
jgi:hypothetical protein